MQSEKYQELPFPSKEEPEEHRRPEEHKRPEQIYDQKLNPETIVVSDQKLNPETIVVSDQKLNPETIVVNDQRPEQETIVVNTSLSDIYPFINDLVDTFYTEQLNSLIQQSIEQEQDKSVFMMFIMMYFGIHLKLKSENDQDKKDQIKLLLNDLIKNPEKRKYCIEMFESRFNHLFLQQPSSENKKILSIKNKRK